MDAGAPVVETIADLGVVGETEQALRARREVHFAGAPVDIIQALLAAGEFPPGSMGPKIESCIAYARATGRTGVITSVEALEGALAGTDGTRITP